MLTNKTVNTANKTVMLTNKTVNTANKTVMVPAVETVGPVHVRPTLIKFKNSGATGVVIATGDSDFNASAGCNGGVGGNSSNNLTFIAVLTDRENATRNLETSEGNKAWFLTTDPTSVVSIFVKEVLPQEGSKYVPAKFLGEPARTGDSIEVWTDSGVIHSQVIGDFDEDSFFPLTRGGDSDAAGIRGGPFYDWRAIAGTEPPSGPFAETTLAPVGRVVYESQGFPYPQRPEYTLATAFPAGDFTRVRHAAEAQNAVIDLKYTGSLIGTPVFHKAGALAGFISWADPATGNAVLVGAYSFERACHETIKEFNGTYNSLFHGAPLDFVFETEIISTAFRRTLALAKKWSGLMTAFDSDNNTHKVVRVPEAIDADGNLVEPFTAGSVAFGTLANNNQQLMNDLHQNSHRGVLTIDSIAYTDFNSGKLTTFRGGTAENAGIFRYALDTALNRCDPNKVILIGGNWEIYDQDKLAPEVKKVEYKLSPGNTTDVISSGKKLSRQLIEAPTELKFDEPQYVHQIPGTAFTSMDALRSAIIAASASIPKHDAKKKIRR